MPIAICRVYHVAVVLYLALTLTGCATMTTAKLPPEEPAMHSVSEFSDDEPVVDIADPWQMFNRSMYRFNYNFDKYVFIPVVAGYEFITPTFIQKGFSNFFDNIGEVRTLYNSVLQLKGKKFLTTVGRFLTNSTVGIGGLFDPASSLGMKKENEDFGRTLGYWGVHPGPYLVVPVLGPNTLRSASGFAVDGGIRFAAINAIDPLENVNNGNSIMAGITTLESIDTRHRVTFRYYESGYPFEYDLLRFLYHKRGELLLMK
ncbi:MAG: putative phospholipid-binding lipoprotein MlaA precursor [Smithella sp. PtaU1.Bin162]|nr:MAG: putative phospholipid-binding lipoprotein MlaA precursor [Smithella sp. PtaU1.Bin162]